MKPYSKIILSTLIGLLLLAFVALISVPFVVDVNDFKTQIEEAVAQNTGRELVIEDDIDLSLFPWIGITTGKLTLKNNAGFTEQPFAQIAEGQIKVKLLPLLFNQLEVNEIVLKGLKLNLNKNSQGLSNWDDLVTLIQNREPSKNPLKLLEIAGVSIQNADIVWDNQEIGEKIEIKDFNFNSEKLVFNQPVSMFLDFSAYNPQRDLTETVELSGDVLISETLDVFDFKKIKFKNRAEGKFLPDGNLLASSSGDIKLDLKHKTLKLAPLHTQIASLTISTSSVISWAEKTFKVSGLVHIPNFDAVEFVKQQLKIKLPEMVDEKALTWLAADFQFNADANHARLQNLEVQVDETMLKGEAQISNFSEPAISVKASLDKVNFDRYLPPPRPEEKRKNASFNVAAEKANLLPLEMLKKLNLNSHITIDELKINNMTMQGIKLQVNAQKGQIQSSQSIDRFYQGAYKGRLILNVSQDLPTLDLHQQFSHIQIEPLLANVRGQSSLAGVVDLNASLEAVGRSEFELKSSLNGRLSFLAKDLLVQGFNLQKIVDNGKILIGNAEESSHNKKEHTFFSKVSGNAIISNGFLSNNDLSAVSSKSKVSGMGFINLFSQQLDYKIIAVLMKDKLLPSQAKVGNNTPVFINIGGTLDDPAYQVDLAAMGMSL